MSYRSFMVVTLSLTLTLCCWTLLLGCNEEEGAPQLSASHHPGWDRADCATCHTLADIHGGDRDWPDCFGCHGGNGGPTRPADHGESGCNTCHANGSAPWDDVSHAGYEPYEPDGCMGCHG